MKSSGTFEVKMTGEPPYDERGGVTLGRASFAKTFSGPLVATSTVQMLAARGPIANSAGYVALERIVGELDGRAGSFVVVHMGLMNRGQQSLTIHIVPDSGTDGLAAIAGTMDIQIVSGQHNYTIDYTIDAEKTAT